MKTTQIATIISLMTGLLTSVAADKANPPSKSSVWDRYSFRYEKSDDHLFRDRELSLDLFGTYASRDFRGVRNDRLGGGLGIGYFLTRFVGIGADSYLEEWKTPYRVNGNVVVRLPLDSWHIAPYVFGGGGREFKYAPQWTAHGGAGVEFRLNHHTKCRAQARE